MVPESLAFGILFGVLMKLFLKVIGFNGKGRSGIRPHSFAAEFRNMHQPSCRINVCKLFAEVGKSAYFSSTMMCLHCYFSFISTFWFVNPEILKFLGIIFVFISATYVLDTMRIDIPTIFLSATVVIISAVGIIVKLTQLVNGDKEELMKSIIDQVERDVKLASSFFEIVTAVATAFGWF
jgi:hypothetical protein